MYVVKQGFYYAHDGLNTEFVEAGTERNFRPELVEGLIGANYISLPGAQDPIVTPAAPVAPIAQPEGAPAPDAPSVPAPEADVPTPLAADDVDPFAIPAGE